MIQIQVKIMIGGGKDKDTRGTKRRSRRYYFDSNPRGEDRKEEERNRQATRRRFRKPEFESNPRDGHDRREEKRSRKHERIGFP